MLDSTSIGTGVKHKSFGLGHIIKHGEAQSCLVKFLDDREHMFGYEDLDEVPTDMNGKHIEVGNLILYPIKGGSCGASIWQGTVVSVKRGKNSGLGGSVTWKLGIKPIPKYEGDDYLPIKSHQWPEHCIVIDQSIIRTKSED